MVKLRGFLSRLFWTSCLGVTLFGCAGKEVTRVQDLDQSAKEEVEVPHELLNRFKVTDAGASPSPTPAPVLQVTESKRSKRKKKSLKKQITSVDSIPFQYPTRRPKVDPFWVGEKLTYAITFFGVQAGDLTLEVLPSKEVNDRKVYHLKGSAKTAAVFNWVYRLNDWIESYWDWDGLFSHRFRLVLDETKQSRDALELYDHQKKQSFYWNRRNHVTKGFSETKEYNPITPFSQDSFSALFYLRSLPLEDGKVYEFPVNTEGKSWDAVVTVVRREKCDYPGVKTQCIVVKPQTRYNGVMKQEHGDSFIYLTDDDRRFVVRVEAKVKIGTVVAELESVVPGEKQ